MTYIVGGEKIYNAEMMFVSQHGGCPGTQGGTLYTARRLLVTFAQRRQ
jgi:hypothetical protein